MDKTTDNTDKKNKKKENVRQEPAVRVKAADMIVSVLFLLIIFGFGIMIYVLPQKSFSEDENRSLQTLPSFESPGDFFKSLFSGKFGDDVGKFYADQFPARDVFVGAKGVFEAAMLKGQNNDVVFGKDGYLLTRFDNSDEELLKANINKLDTVLSKFDVPRYMIIPPRTQDVLLTKLPAGFPTDNADGLYERLDGIMADTSFGYIKLRETFIEEDAKGREIYYKTDHHWTSLGAYTAYGKIAGAVGFDKADDFNIVTVTEDFFGTTWSKAGAKWISPDSIQIYDTPDRESFHTDIMKYRDGSDEILKTLDAFYDESFLETKDKYAYFLSGNYADVRIYKDEADKKREKILVFKDSFANSLVPFLAVNYDIRLIDPRQYTGTTSSLFEGENYAFVLCCFNMDFLTTNTIRMA